MSDPGAADSKTAEQRSAEQRIAAVVKAYDVRARAPEQLDTDVVAALGAAFATWVGAGAGGGAVAVGRDMRDTSKALAAALAEAITSTGADVLDLGLCSTDLVYLVSGAHEVPAVMVTASHNPAGYNGLKLCRSGARPVGTGTGLDVIAADAVRLLRDGIDRVTPAGTIHNLDALAEYATALTGLVPSPCAARDRPLRVVVDAGNGMAGHVVPTVFDRLDVDLVPLYFELDGSFPHHEANPLDPANLVDLQRAVVAHGADLGLAFDGDADRCFVVDERGEAVSPSAITCLIAAAYLRREPGATILHNVICSRAVPEVIAENGGVAVRTPVGHSTIKAEMARTGAVFGGEHSGHFYFRDFYLADTGMLAALHTMAAAQVSPGPVSALIAGYERYAASGEINQSVDDPSAVTERAAGHFADRPGVRLDRLDGLTVEHEQWWFNVRPSQTEPLLRLNIEGSDAATMRAVRDEVLAIIADR